MCSWGEITQRITEKFGCKRVKKHFAEANSCRSVQKYCKSLGLSCTKRGVGLKAIHNTSYFSQRNERKMTIEELRRHRMEIALFLACQKLNLGTPTGLPLDIVSLITSMFGFASIEDDYRSQKLSRSERGLEKADGQLYEAQR